MKYYFIFLVSLFTVASVKAQSVLEVINTNADEYGIAFITNELVCFTRSDGEKKLMLTQKVNGTWSLPTVAVFTIDWDGEYPTFDRTNSRLYFSSTRPKPNETITQPRNDIWYVEYENGSWTSPTHLGGAFSRKGIDSGAFGVGDEIFFHSDRSGTGMNSVDIYQASIDSKEPVKLSVSSDLLDGETHIFNNGTSMLFMSAGHGAIGRSDIFVSYLVNREWTTPEPIDTTGSINTEAWEYSPSLSTDGKTLYFTRIEQGNADILSFPVGKLSKRLSTD